MATRSSAEKPLVAKIGIKVAASKVGGGSWPFGAGVGLSTLPV